MSTATAVEVKEKPFILSGAKVRAILEGRKTQERRLVTVPKWLTKMEPDLNCMHPGKAMGVTPCLFVCRADGSQQRLRNPYGWPDVVPVHLWGREAMRCDERGMFYTADGALVDKRKIPDNLKRIAEENDPFHMPRWASRIILEIQNVRAERLQEISEADAIAEGVRTLRDGSGTYAGREGPGNLVTPWATAKEAFADVWDSINARRGFGWQQNVWVWAISFKKL